MGIFGSKDKRKKKVSMNEYSWKENKIAITEDGYIISEGSINANRIPIRHIDTITYSMNVTKDIGVPEIQIIGKGVILGTLKVANETKDELQDWLLARLGL